MGRGNWKYETSPYQVLHLGNNSTDEEIRSMARKLTKVWHPDRFARDGDSELAKMAHEAQSKVNEARDFLLNPTCRWEYDNSHPSAMWSADDWGELQEALAEVDKLRAREAETKKELAAKVRELATAERRLNERNIQIQRQQDDLKQKAQLLAQDRARADALERTMSIQRPATLTPTLPNQTTRSARPRAAAMGNRQLAAQLRKAGITPNGAPWEAAKQAASAGEDPVRAAMRV